MPNWRQNAQITAKPRWVEKQCIDCNVTWWPSTKTTSKPGWVERCRSCAKKASLAFHKVRMDGQ